MIRIWIGRYCWLGTLLTVVDPSPVEVHVP